MGSLSTSDGPDRADPHPLVWVMQPPTASTLTPVTQEDPA
ncbi:MAG: hypothetical protein MOP51_57 [Citricoccus sp.]|nr:hypothetical protein [Citricoccus sp. WCRC_4]